MEREAQHMKPIKEIVILGDIEMGGGTLTDDFISDRTLSKLIGDFSKRNHPVDLVLNGDTFDFLKCPATIGNMRYPRHITQEISLNKLKLIYQAHTRVFEALKTFVQKKAHRLFFIIGNHDHDLFYTAVQNEIKRLIHAQGNVFFRMAYTQHRVHAEHGHQYDFLNKINPKLPFLYHKGNVILSIPWVSFGIISRFMDLKEQYPFLERVKPYPLIFSHHQAVAKEFSWRTAEYFLKGVIYYPLRYFYDPTYTFPRHLFQEFYRRWKNSHWDVDEIVDTFKRRNR
jgi:UDP-2,3-diacylglucosamine pyrophosphatase LpxH